MYARVKSSGPRQYVQLVEGHHDDSGKVRQRVVVTHGRVDQMRDGTLDALIGGLQKAARHPRSVSSARWVSFGSAATSASCDAATRSLLGRLAGSSVRITGYIARMRSTVLGAPLQARGGNEVGAHYAARTSTVEQLQLAPPSTDKQQ